jgi:hypothetical protein
MSEVNVARMKVHPIGFAGLLTYGTRYAQKTAMFWRRVLALVVPLLFVLCATRVARAQAVTLVTGGIARVNADGSAASGATSSYVNPNARINGADCYGPDDKGISYVFPVTVSGGTSAMHVEIWVGSADCSPLTSRSGTTPTCWPVSATMFLPNSSVQNITIRAQDIVSQITATSKALTYSAATSTACTSSTQLASVSVYFLLLDGSSNPIGTGASWPMKVKLVGPAAPTTVTADGIDTGGATGKTAAVNVTWSQSTDTDLVGYRIFLDSSGSTASTDGGGGTLVTTCADGGFADGGIDDAGDAVAIPVDGGCTTTTVYDAGSGSTCGSATLYAGARADQLTATASPGKTDTQATLTGLSSGASYTVAVATVDSYDNVGPLSTPACATPTPISDFWKKYLAAGGQGGSFRCATEPGAPVGGVTLGVGAAFLALAWARRRRGRR